MKYFFLGLLSFSSLLSAYACEEAIDQELQKYGLGSFNRPKNMDKNFVVDEKTGKKKEVHFSNSQGFELVGTYNAAGEDIESLVVNGNRSDWGSAGSSRFYLTLKLDEKCQIETLGSGWRRDIKDEKKVEMTYEITADFCADLTDAFLRNPQLLCNQKQIKAFLDRTKTKFFNQRSFQMDFINAYTDCRSYNFSFPLKKLERLFRSDSLPAAKQ